MFTHNHEEADTMIHLHVIDAISDSTLRAIDVWSPDTDVLILLMDLVALYWTTCFINQAEVPHWKRQQLSLDQHS